MQFYQDPVPLIHTNKLLSAGYGIYYIPEAVFLVWGKVERQVDGVY